MVRLSERIELWLGRYGLYGALVVAWTAMLGSLYLSEARGYVPCLFCWYQRGVMYPLALILAAGLLLRTRWLPYIVLPISIFGIGLSGYHYLLQKTMLFPATSCGDGAPCTTIWINWLGFITIPFLALTAFFLVTVCTALVLAAPADNDRDETDAINEAEGEPGEHSGNASGPRNVELATPATSFRTATPWLPVGGAIAAVLLFYALFFSLDPARVQAADQLMIADTSTHSVESGAQLYNDACVACHGVDLAGVEGLGNALANNEFIQTHSNEEVLAMIRDGRAASDPANGIGVTMPASGGRPSWTDSQVLSVIEYIRSWQN